MDVDIGALMDGLEGEAVVGGIGFYLITIFDNTKRDREFVCSTKLIGKK